MSCFENNIDPDQPASQTPTDQDLHCFSTLPLNQLLKTETMQHIWLNILEECSIKKCSAGQQQRLNVSRIPVC